MMLDSCVLVMIDAFLACSCPAFNCDCDMSACHLARSSFLCVSTKRQITLCAYWHIKVLKNNFSVAA